MVPREAVAKIWRSQVVGDVRKEAEEEGKEEDSRRQKNQNNQCRNFMQKDIIVRKGNIFVFFI